MIHKPKEMAYIKLKLLYMGVQSRKVSFDYNIFIQCHVIMNNCNALSLTDMIHKSKEMAYIKLKLL